MSVDQFEYANYLYSQIFPHLFFSTAWICKRHIGCTAFRPKCIFICWQCSTLSTSTTLGRRSLNGVTWICGHRFLFHWHDP